MTYKIYKSFCVNKIKDNTKRFVKISQIVLPFIKSASYLMVYIPR